MARPGKRPDLHELVIGRARLFRMCVYQQRGDGDPVRWGPILSTVDGVLPLTRYGSGTIAVIVQLTGVRRFERELQMTLGRLAVAAD